MLLTNGKETFKLTNDVQIAAFKASGYVEAEPEKVKKPAKNSKNK